MVSDVLHFTDEPEKTLELSELVHTKTKGNPFFTISFLTKLHQSELVVRFVPLSSLSLSLTSQYAAS
jgi:predicted ATPase